MISICLAFVAENKVKKRQVGRSIRARHSTCRAAEFSPQFLLVTHCASNLDDCQPLEFHPPIGFVLVNMVDIIPRLAVANL